MTRKPQRTCVGCRKTSDTTPFVRWVLVAVAKTSANEGTVAESVVELDVKGSKKGRGAWTHVSKECVDKGLRGGLDRSFRSRVRVRLDEALSELNQLAAKERRSIRTYELADIVRRVPANRFSGGVVCKFPEAL